VEVIIMKGLDTKGLEEVEAIQSRVKKLYGFGRLSEKEFKKIINKVTELKTAIEEVIE